MPKDPVCGMDLGPGEAAAAVTHAGIAYSFCSEKCAAAFTADPDSFAGPGTVSVTDPVCGMRFRLADTAYHRLHVGTTYHFCSEECYRHFVLSPDSYAHPSEMV